VTHEQMQKAFDAAVYAFEALGPSTKEVILHIEATAAMSIRFKKIDGLVVCVGVLFL